MSILDGNDNDVSNNMSHIANINPFRYRGYYYDKETEMYYWDINIITLVFADLLALIMQFMMML